MYTHITTSAWSAPKRPEAFITKAKKRIKQFSGQVYLNDGDEYEIELFNPTQEVVLAKIKLDGNYIAGGGIVLRRGERVFLERFLDSPEKFKFSTYVVNGNNKEVQDAVAKNGYVEIEFYSEYKPAYYNQPFSVGGTTGGYNPFTITNNTTGTPNWENATFTTSCSTNTFYNASLSTANSSLTYSTKNNNLSVDGDIILNGQSLSKALGLNDKKVETGTTERGSDSNQTFKYSNKTFSSVSFWNVAWQILPNSQKQYTAEEVVVNYCGNCGAKRKKSSFKFCPHCGTKF